jgi:hypothetical protein
MSLDPKIKKDKDGVSWLKWTPDTTAEGYAFTTPSGHSRTFDATRGMAKLGRPAEPFACAISALDIVARAPETATYPPSTPPTPPNTGVTVDAFECVMYPDQHEPVPGSGNKYAFTWTEWTSSVTPRPMPNGEPPGRGVRKGERYWKLKGYCFLTDEGCGRLDNEHLWATSEAGGWEGEVSPMALDCYDAGYRSKSGASFEANFEYERAQDTHDTEPHSGGMSVGFPAYLAARGSWHWLLTDMLLGSSGDGIYRVWDWVTGQLLIDLQGINTLGPRMTGCQGWEGTYVNTGVGAEARCRQTPALYALHSDGPLAVLRDKPQLVKTWNSTATGRYPDSSVQLGVERLTVPAGKVAA